MAAPSKFNPLSGGSLQITDEKRKAYPEAWIGMTDDVEGASKWLRVGGISDGTTARLALDAERTTIEGSLGVNCLPTDQALEVFGSTRMRGSLSVYKELTAGSVKAGTVVSAGQLALSCTHPLGVAGTPRGAWTSLSSNAYHGDGEWHFVDSLLPAVTLEMDSRNNDEARFAVYTTTRAERQSWKARLTIDGETGTVAVDKQLTAGSLKVTGDATLDSHLTAGSLQVGGDAKLSGALLNASGGSYLSAAEVIAHAGALPCSAWFKTAGRPLVLLASGSGRLHDAVGNVGMDIKVDGVSRRQAKACTNEKDSHQPFVPVHFVLTDLPGGDHKIELEALAGTITDQNDYFSVAVIEL